MVIVLVILTILAFVLADVLLTRRARGLVSEEALAPVEAIPSVVPIRSRADEAPNALLPDGLHFHPGHTWAKTAKGGLVAVGLSELAGKVVGRIERVELPKVGEAVCQGTASWSIHRRGRTIRLVSPVTGVVAEVNESLQQDPELINRSPYTEGWAFRTRLQRVKEDLKNLYTGTQVRKFMDLAKAWVCFSFSPPDTYYKLTCQDGGEIVDGIGDRLSDEAWEKLAKEFFLAG